MQNQKFHTRTIQHNIFIFSKQKLFLFRRLNIDLKILVQFKNKNIKNVCVYLFKLWIYWYEHRNIFFGMFDVHKTWKYILLVFDIWRFIWRQVFIGLHLNFMNIEYHFFVDVMKLYITTEFPFSNIVTIHTWNTIPRECNWIRHTTLKKGFWSVNIGNLMTWIPF